jgi:hypothetical protein
MIELQPRKQFQTNEKIKKELATIATSDNFQTVLSFALAEFVMRTTPSAEQVAAIRAFIACLLNLSQQDDPMPKFPVKQLDHTLYNPEQPPANQP